MHVRVRVLHACACKGVRVLHACACKGVACMCV